MGCKSNPRTLKIINRPVSYTVSKASRRELAKSILAIAIYTLVEDMAAEGCTVDKSWCWRMESHKWISSLSISQV